MDGKLLSSICVSCAYLGRGAVVRFWWCYLATIDDTTACINRSSVVLFWYWLVFDRWFFFCFLICGFHSLSYFFIWHLVGESLEERFRLNLSQRNNFKGLQRYWLFITRVSFIIKSKLLYYTFYIAVISGLTIVMVPFWRVWRF